MDALMRGITKAENLFEFANDIEAWAKDTLSSDELINNIDNNSTTALWSHIIEQINNIALTYYSKPPPCNYKGIGKDLDPPIEQHSCCVNELVHSLPCNELHVVSLSW